MPFKKGHKSYTSKNLENLKFGKLKVTNKSKKQDRYIYWLCICDCGSEHWVRSTYLTTKKIQSCGCSYNKPRELSTSYTGHEHISGTMWAVIKKGAKSRKLQFSISIEDAWNQYKNQKGKCRFTKLDLKFSSTAKSYDGTASLDRIDSSKGYTIDNIQWVHKKINIMKQNMSDIEFIEWCKLISKNN